MSESTESRTRGTKPKSIVWKYYKTEEDTDGHKVLKCCFCSTGFTASVARNATKLRQHLIRKCRDIPSHVKTEFVDDIEDENRHQFNRIVIKDLDTRVMNKRSGTMSQIITKIIVKNRPKGDVKPRLKNILRVEDSSDELTGATDMTDMLSRSELKTRVRTLEEENLRLNSRLELCRKQNDALIQMTKHLELSLKLMEKLEAINKIHSIRFDDNEAEVDGLTDELNTNNESAEEWRQKLKVIDRQLWAEKEREDNYQRNSEKTINSKTQRPQSSIWKYYKLGERDQTDGLRAIECLFCSKTFRHKNLNAFKSRTHIVENCEKCPQDIKEKENIWSEPQPKSKVDIWSHFKLSNSEDKTCAECQYCGHKYYYRNATKCRQHLVFKCQQIPFDVKETIRNQCDQSFLNNSKSLEPIKTRLSNIWNHYHSSDDNEGKQTYRCIYCRQQYSTRNATKFRQHLVDRCESVPQEVRDELATECMESTRTWTQAKVPVWSHFELWEETGKQMCRCAYCGITYAYRNATKCRIHLMMKCDKIPVDLRFKLRKESNELYTSALAAKTQPKQKKPKARKMYVKTGPIIRKPKSRIWEFFLEDKDGKGDTIRRCTFCEHVFGSGTSRNATKMRDHLALFCKSIPEDVKNRIVDENTKYGRPYRNKPPQPLKWLECCWPGCEMKFPKRSRLLNHQRVHTGDIVRVPCDWPGCEWTGRSRHCVTIHKYIHTGEKPYHCDWPGCEFKTAKPSSLCVHKMRHKNLLRYKCDWPDCERTFLTSSQRTVHKMVHMGIKPHACQYCDKRYPQLNKLKVHQNKHHFNEMRINSYNV